MPGFFGHRPEQGPQGGAPVPEPTQVLGNSPFRIRATNVDVEVFYGDPKSPQSFSGETMLNEPRDIVGSMQADGTVRGVLDSPDRRRVVGNAREVIKEDGNLAEELVAKQSDLQKLLDAHSVRRGTLVRAIITAPASAVLPQQPR